MASKFSQQSMIISGIAVTVVLLIFGIGIAGFFAKKNDVTKTNEKINGDYESFITSKNDLSHNPAAEAAKNRNSATRSGFLIEQNEYKKSVFIHFVGSTNDIPKYDDLKEMPKKTKSGSNPEFNPTSSTLKDLYTSTVQVEIIKGIQIGLKAGFMAKFGRTLFGGNGKHIERFTKEIVDSIETVANAEKTKQSRVFILHEGNKCLITTYTDSTTESVTISKMSVSEIIVEKKPDSNKTIKPEDKKKQPFDAHVPLDLFVYNSVPSTANKVEATPLPSVNPPQATTSS